MKKIHVGIVAVVLVLSGCFHGNGEETEAAPEVTPGFRVYETEQFSLNIPDEWEVLTPINFKSGTPPNTIVAFRSNIRNPAFTANVAVLKNEIEAENVTSLDYAKTLRQKLTDEVVEARPLEVKERTILIGGEATETLFVYLEGRESPDADLKQFMQTSGVKDASAYIVIGAFLASEGEAIAEKVKTIVQSLSIK